MKHLRLIPITYRRLSIVQNDFEFSTLGLDTVLSSDSTNTAINEDYQLILNALVYEK